MHLEYILISQLFTIDFILEPPQTNKYVLFCAMKKTEGLSSFFYFFKPN